MSTQTIPPPTATFSANILQWTIFDEYQVLNFLLTINKSVTINQKWAKTSERFYLYWQEDYAQQQREKEKEKKVPLTQKKEEIKKKAQIESLELNNRMLQAAKTLERMVNQNIFDDISQGKLLIFLSQYNFWSIVCYRTLIDYRYWDDPSDEFKAGEGSLLPLWKFSYEKTKKHDITDMCFNTRYYDLFAVAFGTR